MPGKLALDGIEFGDGWSLVKEGDTVVIQRFGVRRIRLDSTGIGFLGSTPVAQASAYTQTYSTADKTHATPTGVAVAGAVPAGGTGAAAGAWDTAANRDTAITTISEIKTSVNAAIVDLADLKQLVNSVVDDLQALGLVG